jgi:hypothetical protein
MASCQPCLLLSISSWSTSRAKIRCSVCLVVLLLAWSSWSFASCWTILACGLRCAWLLGEIRWRTVIQILHLYSLSCCRRPAYVAPFLKSLLDFAWHPFALLLLGCCILQLDFVGLDILIDQSTCHFDTSLMMTKFESCCVPYTNCRHNHLSYAEPRKLNNVEKTFGSVRLLYSCPRQA